jgi:hypothetical protein
MTETERKRVVRDKGGKIIGIEPGDPNAPTATDFVSELDRLLEAQRKLETAAGASGVDLEARRHEMVPVARTIADGWRIVPDSARYALLNHIKEQTGMAEQSINTLANVTPPPEVIEDSD